MRDALRDLVIFEQFKNMKNTHGGACNVTKSDTPPWMFFYVFYIAQMVPNLATNLISYIVCYVVVI